jgi:hypothetical protein
MNVVRNITNVSSGADVVLLLTPSSDLNKMVGTIYGVDTLSNNQYRSGTVKLEVVVNTNSKAGGHAQETFSFIKHAIINSTSTYTPVTCTYNSKTWFAIRIQGDAAEDPEIARFSGFLQHNGGDDTLKLILTSAVGSVTTFTTQETVQHTEFSNQNLIVSGGKVGIGATDPGVKLHVNGAIYLASEDLGTGVGGGGFGSAPDTAEKAKIYIEFGDGGTANDWCYLRQIGASNLIELSFDFHDDGTDARFSIRDLQSTSTPDNITTRFRVDGAAVSIPGSLSVAGSGVSSDDRIKYNEVDIPNALNLINQLKPQKYEKLVDVSVADKRGIWIPSDEEWESVKDDHKYVHEFGFIAQAVRNIPDMAFLVTGEETKMITTTKTPIEYNNLTTDEQGTYTPSYVYRRKLITQEEYSILTSNVQELYTLGYVKETETQNPLSLNYNGLFVLAIGAIKELKAENDAIKARLDALENA